jgi:hypothetical protein
MKLGTETFARIDDGEGWLLSKTRGGSEKIEDKALKLQKLAHDKGYYCICGTVDDEGYGLYLVPEKGVRYVIEKFYVGSHAGVEPESVYDEIAVADGQNPLIPFFADEAGLKARFSKPVTEELIAVLEDTLLSVEPMMDEDEGTIAGYVRQNHGLHLWWD